MVDFVIEFAELPLLCSFRYPDTSRKFTDYFTRKQPINQSLPVSLEERDWLMFLDQGMPSCAHTEYSVFAAPVSDSLLDYNRVVIHAAAFQFRDRAYLIAAPSGVGKSTQIKWLEELHPGEFRVICGDRPILSFHEDNIIVHPSPWNGKEDWKGGTATPLAAVILLTRGEKNQIMQLSKADAAFYLYPQFIQLGWDAEKIVKVAELETKLLNTVPCWSLQTNTVPYSTKLLYETISAWDG